MAFEPPDGILDIGNATLRVGKLEVAETSGLNQGLQNIIKNDLLITENTEYTTNQKWGLKLPTTWVGEFEVKGHSGKYIDFNFYNENSASNAQGYNLTFKDTTMTLRYDGGSALGGGAATIPTIVNTYRKVNIFFERGVISVSIDGTRYLYHKETDGFNQGLGVASRVVSATGSAFVNLFIEQNAANSAFKNLRIVNGRFISDKTSNIAFIGGNLGVGVNSPKEALDIRGNMHLTRVSNVSQISVDSNVVAEYTGPHDRPLRKYPEVELDVNAMTSPGVGGYIVAHSGQYPGFAGWTAFGEEFTTTNAENSSGAWIDSNPGSYAKETADAHNGVVGSITTAVQTAGTLKLASNTPVGAWISLELPTSIKLQRIEMRARLQHLSETNLNEVALQSFPREFGIWGYDGSNWVLLKSVTGHSANSAFGYTPTHINATTAYNKYAIVVTRTNAVGGGDSYDRNFTAIGQLYFYGHEEGSGSLDTTLKTVYNVPATTGTQLEVYYDAKDLADGAVTSVTDLSPNTNNGTVSGDPQVSNGAFVFDGVGDSIGGSVTNGTGELNFTISMWVKPNTLVGSPFYFGPNTVGKAFGTNITTSIFYLFINGGTAQLYNTSDLMNTGEWSHLTFYRNNGEMSIYRNGIYIYPISTGSGALSLDANTVFTVGSRAATGTFFDGSIANFRIYNKVLNAGQVQELYDYQKDYFLGSKSQLTIYKGHLGVGVTEPSGQLELAGDERIQEYPPRALTGYETLIPGHGVFTAYGSSQNNTGQTYSVIGAFDKTISPDSSCWLSKAGTYSSGLPTSSAAKINGVSGEWCALQCPYPIKLQSFTTRVRSASSGENGRMAKSGIIWGSNDGATWYQVHSWGGRVYSDTNSNYFEVNSTEYYSHHAFQATETQSNADATVIGEWRLFGTPGPTTLDKGSLTLGRSLDVPRISRYDVDTETPKTDYLICDLDTSVEPFNEQFINDISGAGHDMLFFANSADYNGYDSVQKAFYFNGDVYGRVVYLRELGGNAEWTQSMWFKTEEFRTSPAYNILSFFGTKSTGLGHIWSYRNDQMWQDHYGKGVYFNYTFEENKWYHAVSVYHGNTSTDPNVRSSMYLNGVKQTLIAQGLTSDPQNLPAPTSLELADYINASNLRHKGWISNYKMYSKALDDSDALKLYKLGRSKGTLSIPETNVLIGSGKHSSIQQVANGPNAHLDVHGHAMISGELQAMSGNFHNVLGFARGGGATNSDRWRTDNCLVCMVGQTNNSPNASEHIGILIRRSPHYMPWTLELRQAITNNNNTNFTYRSMECFGTISGTTIGNTSGVGGGVSLSAGNRGDDVVCFNIEVNRSSRHYGVFMIKFAYYYGIKGREY